MRQSKLTPGSNLLWESSRMMLPEHVEAINRQREEMNKKERPHLDEQKLVEIERALKFSFHEGAEVELEIFGEYEDRRIRGKVININRDQVKIELIPSGYNWVNTADITDVNEPF